MIGCLCNGVVVAAPVSKGPAKQTVAKQSNKKAPKQVTKANSVKKKETKMYVTLQRSHLLGQTDGEVFAKIFIPNDIAPILSRIILHQQEGLIPELIQTLKTKSTAKTYKATAESLKECLDSITNAIAGLKSKFRLAKQLTGKGNKIECVFIGSGQTFEDIRETSLARRVDYTNNATKEIKILESLQTKLQPVLKDLQTKAAQEKHATTKKKPAAKPKAKKKITPKKIEVEK